MSLTGSLKDLKNLEIDSRVYLLLKKIWRTTDFIDKYDIHILTLAIPRYILSYT